MMAFTRKGARLCSPRFHSIMAMAVGCSESTCGPSILGHLWKGKEKTFPFISLRLRAMPRLVISLPLGLHAVFVLLFDS